MLGCMKQKCVINCILGLSLVTGCLTLSGCGKEITEQDIKGSKIYQDLETDYTSLQRRYDKLEKSQEKQDMAVDRDVTEYLNKVRASHFVKLSYALHNSDISASIENTSLVKQMKDSLADGIYIANESVADCKKNHAYQYIYTFYNEDNSLCKCDVYDQDRVIFAQFPDKVFLVEGIDRLGDGLIKREDTDAVIASSIYTKLYHAQIGFLGENVMSEEKMRDVVSELYVKDYQALVSRPEEAQGEPKKVYTYYVDGEKYLVHVYDACYSVEDGQTNVTWYGKVAASDESTTDSVAASDESATDSVAASNE